MSEIVLNEVEWTKEIMTNKSLGKKPSETIRRVAQYLFEVEGLNKSQVKNKVNEYILKCDPYSSIVKWDDTVSKIVEYSSKHKMINIGGVSVTENEMKSILTIKSKQEQRLCFTLLCLSKYWNIVNATNNNWVNTKDSDIMRMANINTSIKRQCAMLKDLSDMGLIQFSRKVDNTNIQVCFSDFDEEAMFVSDFRNIGYQFMNYCGYGEFFTCSKCGVIEKYKSKSASDSNRGRKRVYCKKCSLL